LTYHHYRRLSEHWPESAKHLRPAATLVALTIASHLNQESSRWAISAKTISTWANGLSRGSIDTAVKQLEALGIFGVSRESQRRPREFKLLVECPQGCERAKDHNTPNELKAALAKPQTEPTEMPNLETTSTEMPNLLATEMPNLEREMPNLLATNKESIEINKKDDKQDSFEFLFITETLKELNETNQLTSGHALLKEALEDNPELVIERAQEVMAKGTVPKKYLKASIINHPESLIKKPAQESKTETDSWANSLAKQNLKNKHAKQWETLKTNEPTLSEWETIQNDYLGPIHLEFLARVCPQSLTSTAAKIVSKAAYYGVSLKDCKSLTQAGELTSEYPDLPTLEAQRQRAQEARERALGIKQETF
jgi:hypothetical protein